VVTHRALSLVQLPRYGLGFRRTDFHQGLRMHIITLFAVAPLPDSAAPSDG
jgi:hypothetical protein